MKKHTRVLSFIAFCIVLGALPIIVGCQSESSTDLDWWALNDFQQQFMSIHIANNFNIDGSVLHLFDTGTATWITGKLPFPILSENEQIKYYEDRVNGQVERLSKFNKWEYTRFGDWATIRYVGNVPYFLTPPISIFDCSFFPDVNGIGLIKTINSFYEERKLSKKFKQLKLAKIPPQPTGLKSLGKLRFERWQAEDGDYKFIDYWILPTPKPTVLWVEYTNFDNKKCINGLVSWQPGKRNTPSSLTLKPKQKRNVCLINFGIITIFDYRGANVFHYGKIFDKPEEISESIADEVASGNGFLSLVRKGEGQNIPIKIKPPTIILPRQMPADMSCIAYFMPAFLDYEYPPGFQYTWKQENRFITMTFGNRSQPGKTILFLQRLAKPDDPVEWKLWLEDVTINDGQVVKLAHFSGVKDGLYCDIVGHGVTEKQLRDFQAQLVTVTPESMDEEYQGMK